MNIHEYQAKAVLAKFGVPVPRGYPAMSVAEAAKGAHDTPEKIITITVDPVANICPHHVRRLSKALGLDADLTKQMSPLITNLYKAFVDTDMALLEVNPLVVTKDKKLICLDAKVGFDDNALFRHPDILALRDETEEDE